MAPRCQAYLRAYGPEMKFRYARRRRGDRDGERHQAGAHGVVSGAGALTKIGSGTLVLSTTNTYAGGTTVRAGTLEIAPEANLGAATGTLTLDSGALRTTADITTARPVTLGTGNGTMLTVQSAITVPGRASRPRCSASASVPQRLLPDLL